MKEVKGYEDAIKLIKNVSKEVLSKKTNYKKSIGKMQKSKKILHNEWINMHVKKT